MTNISRVRAGWSGFPGAPGVSTFYFLDTATAVDSVHGFFSAIATLLPSDVHITVEPTGDVLDDTNGDLVGAWMNSPVAIVNGGGTASYAAPVGAVVDWLTDTILDTHRLRGRTFMVPLAREYFDTDGGIGAGIVTTFKDAADTLISEQAESFVVWHRPFAGTPATTGHPARAAHAGGHGLITASRVPKKAAVLRSRRD